MNTVGCSPRPYSFLGSSFPDFLKGRSPRWAGAPARTGKSGRMSKYHKTTWLSLEVGAIRRNPIRLGIMINVLHLASV